MLSKYFVEFLGTFIFLSVILSTGQAFPIGLALATVIFFGGAISGGHYNPAVSTMMFIKRSINGNDFLGYVMAQVLGGICAYLFHEHAPFPKK